MFVTAKLLKDYEFKILRCKHFVDFFQKAEHATVAFLEEYINGCEGQTGQSHQTNINSTSVNT